MSDKFAEKKTEEIIDQYKKRWNIKDDDRHYFRSGGKSVEFPKDAKIGDEWTNPKTGKKYKKDGEKSWTQVNNRERFNMRECSQCGRYLKSKNDVNVHLSTGKCIKCHAIEEKKKIVSGEAYTPPAWKKEILFKDTFGNIVMSIDEVIQQYGDLVGHGVLTQLVEGMDRMRDEGERVNEPMYENAKRYLAEIEGRIGQVDHTQLKARMLELKRDLSKKKNQELKKQL